MNDADLAIGPPVELPLRKPLPPFDAESARLKVQMAEDAWNSRNPERVALAYTPDTEWRNRAEFLPGRAEVVEFLRRKWAKEHDYRLRKSPAAIGRLTRRTVSL